MFRVSTLTLALCGLAWFSFAQDGSAEILAQRAVDIFDGRPARSILILGNSRTFYNDMPAMLREIADSAGSPAKLQIETHAKPAFSLEDHWNDGRATRLLADEWDEVIIQGESAAQSSEEQSELFVTYGTKLAGLAHPYSGRPTLIVNWPYDRSVFQDHPDYDRSQHLAFLQKIHSKLASGADMNRLNLAGLWESVSRAHPSIALTVDGNHPSLAGTYLYALAVYGQLSQGPVAQVTYAPDGLDANDAKTLRQAVDAYPLFIG